jgi:hypothetical protein
MRRAVALFCLAFASACGSTAPDKSIEGSYDLVTVDGQPLPYRSTFLDITSSNVTASLESGLLIVSPTGDFSLRRSGTQTVGSGTPSTFSSTMNGTWTAVGSTLTLSFYDPPRATDATYSGGSLTHTEGGRTYVYRRD